MATCCNCGKAWTGVRRSHCPVCHESFNSDSVGDRHRVGDHNDGTRRCLTPTEMNAHGLYVNASGAWANQCDRGDLPRRWPTSLPGARPAPDAPQIAGAA